MLQQSIELRDTIRLQPEGSSAPPVTGEETPIETATVSRKVKSNLITLIEEISQPPDDADVSIDTVGKYRQPALPLISPSPSLALSLPPAQLYLELFSDGVISDLDSAACSPDRKTEMTKAKVETLVQQFGSSWLQSFGIPQVLSQQRQHETAAAGRSTSL